VLGVPSTATDKDIARAYRKLAKQYHPDANPGSEDRFKEISAAHDVLGDAATRKEYDEARRLGPMAGGFGAPGSGGSFRVEDLGDLGDLFGGLFGGRSRRRAQGPQRGADIEAELHLAFEDAVRHCHDIVSCHLLAGQYDYILVARVAGIDDYNRLHQNELSRLPGVIRLETSFALRDVLEPVS